MQREISKIEHFDPDRIPKGIKKNFRLRIISDAFGDPVSIAVMVAKGEKDGPTLGVTAAVHGNELNGIPVIHRLFESIDTSELSGTIIGVPVVNVPSFMRNKRRFPDGVDLNHIMPGNPNGNVSAIYAHRFIDRIVKHFDFLIDLHTASAGRVNSYYVRADMSDAETRRLAILQNADIIVNNPPSDGTLRGAVAEMGIKAITLELGDPSRFQKRMIRSGVEGVDNVLSYLRMTDDEVTEADKESILCKSSQWMYTQKGGLLTVHPALEDLVQEGEKVATLKNIFGEVLEEYHAPFSGVVIGKSVNPINESGGRIMHLGIVGDQ